MIFEQIYKLIEEYIIDINEVKTISEEDYKKIAPTLQEKIILNYILQKNNIILETKDNAIVIEKLRRYNSLQEQNSEKSETDSYLMSEVIEIKEEKENDTNEAINENIIEDAYENEDVTRNIIEKSKTIAKRRKIPNIQGRKKKLLEFYNTKDKKLREELIIENMPIAQQIAEEYYNLFSDEADKEDILGYAYEGLVIAIDSFDPNTLTPFIEHVDRKIDYNIRKYLSEMTILFQGQWHKTYNKYKMQLLKQYELDEYELAEKITDMMIMNNDIKKEEREKNICRIRILNDTYLDENIEYEYDEDPNYTRLVEKELKKVIDEVLDTLTDTERKIIIKRYGLDSQGNKTLQEIADSYNKSRERIRQIEQKAIKKLRHPSRGKPIRSIAYGMNEYNIKKSLEDTDIVLILEELIKHSISTENFYEFFKLKNYEGDLDDFIKKIKKIYYNSRIVLESYKEEELPEYISYPYFKTPVPSNALITIVNLLPYNFENILREKYKNIENTSKKI